MTGVTDLGAPKRADCVSHGDYEVAKTSCGGRTRIEAILKSSATATNFLGQTVRVQGGGTFCFVGLSDGSTAEILQVVVSKDIPGFDTIVKCGAGCSFRFLGTMVASPAKGQTVELSVNDPQKHHFVLFGGVDAAKYPLSKKKHGLEYLREIAHLRPRSNITGCVARIRSGMSMAIHTFFNQRGFLYVHTPIITTSDCEGAGEMFQVTTLLDDSVDKIPCINNKNNSNAKLIDYKKEFFSEKAFLTVSGQLSVENYCCGLSDVYTFGPTFRAENSHTSRHLAEFWMIEPEMAFADIYDDMECAESLLKFCISWALNKCSDDLKWLKTNVDDALIDYLKNIIREPFARVSYTDAIELLQKDDTPFEREPVWGIDMGAEHERCLTEKICKKPVIVYNYPKTFKSFYMKQNEDGTTVAAMDVLLPKIGEIIGGSQREDKLELLDQMIEEKKLDKASYSWYRDLRKYGTVPHAGFGLGFERLIMLVTGIDNIRDVIPYPRYPGHARF